MDMENRISLVAGKRTTKGGKKYTDQKNEQMGRN